MKDTSSIHFNEASIISAKVIYSVFQKYFTFHYSLFTLILGANGKK